jgi:hypothetical protein
LTVQVSGAKEKLALIYLMKTLPLIALLALGFAATPVEAKRGWNGPDLHGINPEASIQLNMDDAKEKRQ